MCMATNLLNPLRPVKGKKEDIYHSDELGLRETVNGMDVVVQGEAEDEGEMASRVQSQNVQDETEMVGHENIEESEGQAHRTARAPHTPSPKEVDEHELTHCPYRSWCDHCVRGQAKDDPHSTVSAEYGDSTVVRVAMDYCFFTEEASAQETDHSDSVAAKTSMTVLVIRKRYSARVEQNSWSWIRSWRTWRRSC